MKSTKPGKLDKKHPEAARDAMEEIKDLTSNPTPMRNDIKYTNANRDRALGEADRTGRNFHEEVAPVPDEESEISKDHDAD
jgi:hypothetical protein